MKSFNSILTISIVWYFLECSAQLKPTQVAKQNETQTSSSPATNPKPSIQPADSDQCGRFSPNRKLVPGILPENYPWMVALSYKSPKNQEQDFKCGGILISKQWVLAAAHCTQVLDQWKLDYVRLGQANLNEATNNGATPINASIDKVIVHPQFTSRNPITNDLALIHLKVPVNYADNIRPICLLDEPKFKALNEHHHGKVTILGYTINGGPGYDQPLLEEWFQEIMNQTRCAQIYAEQKNTIILNEKTLCVESNGSNKNDKCQFATGGVLLYQNQTESRFYLAGISSFGSICFLNDPPDVFTKVSQFMDWIVKTTGEKFWKYSKTPL